MQNNRTLTPSRDQRSYTIKKISLLGLLSALAFLSVLFIRIPVVSFLSFEPKDVIICIGAYIFGPVAGIGMSVVVSVIEMLTISSTGPIGLIMNVLSSVCFVCPAAIIYRRNKKIESAVIGLIAGSLLMTISMILWNFLITPLYMGIPREAVTEMLIPMFLPFNILKASINSVITLFLYKPIVVGMRKANLIPHNPDSKAAKKSSYIILGVSIFVLIATAVLIALAFNGRI